MFEILKKVIHDCLTCEAGDYDPARVVGYMLVLITYFTWLTMTVCMIVFGSAKWDSSNFCKDALLLSGILVTAAGGVWIKKSAEAKVQATTTLP